MSDYNNTPDNLDKEIIIVDDTEVKTTDAGLKARGKLKRKTTIKQKVKKSLVVVLVFLISIVAASVIWVTKEYVDRKTTGYHYKRSCELPAEVEMDISGTRKYLNTAEVFLGMRIVDTAKANEKTTLTASHKETTVVGIKGDQWWSLHNPAAEPRVMDLKEADLYIFMQEGRTYVIKYEDFCR